MKPSGKPYTVVFLDERGNFRRTVVLAPTSLDAVRNLELKEGKLSRYNVLDGRVRCVRDESGSLT